MDLSFDSVGKLYSDGLEGVGRPGAARWLSRARQKTSGCTPPFAPGKGGTPVGRDR